MNSKNQESGSTRVARRRARVRERILAAATQLFAEQGIDNVTLTDVTEEADVSRSNLYSHFESKEALVQAICEPVMAYGREQMVLLERQAPEAAIRGMLRIHAESWQKFPGALLIIHQLTTAPKGEATPEHDQMAAGLDLFEAAAKADLLRMSPELAAKTMGSIIVPFLKLAEDTPDPETFFVETMLRVLLKS